MEAANLCSVFAPVVLNYCTGGPVERLAHLRGGPLLQPGLRAGEARRLRRLRGPPPPADRAVQAGQQAAPPQPHQQHRRPQGEALHGDREEEQAAQREPGVEKNPKFVQLKSQIAK